MTDLLFDIQAEDLRFQKAIKSAFEKDPENPTEVLHQLQEESKENQRNIFKKHYPPEN